MSKSGRSINGWPSTDGGVPPTFNHVTTSRHKIPKFIDELLGHTKVTDDMKELLVANALRFYADFCTILSHEPFKKYDSTEKMITGHTFVFKVSYVGVFLNNIDQYHTNNNII